MAYLIQQIEIIWFLLLTAVLWGAIGWWMRSSGQSKLVAALEQEAEHRVQSLRRARDDYRDQVEELSAGGGALNANQKAQVTEYVRKLESNIATGKNQVVALTEKLDELAAAAQQREAQLASLQDALETANKTTPPGGDALSAEQVRELKRTISKLNARIQTLSQQQQEPMAATEHSKLLDVIRAQKETIAGMVRKFENHPANVPKAHEEKRAQLERTIVSRDKELNRAREQIAQMHERTRAQEKTIAQLNVTADQEDARTSADNQHNFDDEDREALMQAMREQERIIVTLKEQLRKRVTPPARTPVPSVNQQSGDLFAAPPTVLLSAPEGEPDKLQKIHGVGPVLEAKLNELGIFHFHQIAKLSDDDIGWIAAQMNAFPNRILRDRWVSQAAKLAAGDAPDA